MKDERASSSNGGICTCLLVTFDICASALVFCGGFCFSCQKYKLSFLELHHQRSEKENLGEVNKSWYV